MAETKRIRRTYRAILEERLKRKYSTKVPRQAMEEGLAALKKLLDDLDAARKAMRLAAHRNARKSLKQVLKGYSVEEVSNYLSNIKK